MPLAERNATVTWKGDLTSGSGHVSFDSGAISDQAVTWAARTEAPEGKTSPEELIAGAHAACYAMALSNTLATKGHPPEQLHIRASCVADKVGGKLKVVSSTLRVRGRVPGIDAATFESIAREGEQNCPVSNALRNNVRIEVEAELES
jgi:osmotically inducible protein OsmC